ncbi:MAG: HDIG domain-containing protein [Actinobacteria bacterium]|nr:HDIG domain-containing protein [Actinomycetota bacterium]
MSHVKLENYNEFISCVDDILNHPEVKKLARYTHHNHSTRLDHSLSVAYYNFLTCKKIGLDARSAARGGLLHDFFLYEWQDEEENSSAHIYNHPQVALENSEKHFELNDIEREVISMHMWPLAEGRPRYAETYCICAIDKYCACLDATRVASPLARRRHAKLEWAMQTI